MTDRFDAIIIGAGVSGMYQLHKFMQLHNLPERCP